MDNKKTTDFLDYCLKLDSPDLMYFHHIHIVVVTVKLYKRLYLKLTVLFNQNINIRNVFLKLT